MKQLVRSMVVIGLFSGLVPLSLRGESTTIRRSFEPAPRIEIQTVSGDCTVKKSASSQVEVTVEHSFDPAIYQPIFERTEEGISLQETFNEGTSSGYSRWTVEIPEGMEVSFSSASGDLEIGDLNLRLDASTASGDILLTRLKGSLEITSASGDLRLEEFDGSLECSTASGDIHLESGTGAFTVTSASGDIEAQNLNLQEKAYFSVASGNVALALSSPPASELKITAASGDATLDLQGNPLQGQIRVRAMPGSLDSSIPFDYQETESRGNATFLVSVADFGGGPSVEIASASGKVTLRQ